MLVAGAGDFALARCFFILDELCYCIRKVVASAFASFRHAVHDEICIAGGAEVDRAHHKNRIGYLLVVGHLENHFGYSRETLRYNACGDLVLLEEFLAFVIIPSLDGKTP